MGISHKNVGIYQENVGVIFAMAVKFYKKTLAEKDTRTYVFFFLIWKIGEFMPSQNGFMI